MVCLFHLQILPFDEQKDLIMMMPNLSIFHSGLMHPQSYEIFVNTKLLKIDKNKD